MTYLPTEDIYYNTQVYFRKNCWSNMPNDDRVWAERYRKWLAEQGCVIVHYSETNLITNSLGIAPGFHYFAFEKSEDATLFKLRWS